MKKTILALSILGCISGCSNNIEKDDSQINSAKNSTLNIIEKENKKINNILDESLESREITRYLPIRQDISFEGHNYTAIREFFRGNSKYYLAVDLETNETKIILAENSRDLPDNSNFEKSSYAKALNLLEDRKGLQNAGLKNDIKSRENTVYMTADFCPSSKSGFEKEFFENFIKKGHKNVAIAITASWIKKHKPDFAWLIDQKKKHNLNITWVNHTFNHKYDWGEPIEKNFLLKTGTNLSEEILELEKVLIKNGEIPSIFMRFPGLVSNKKIRGEILDKYSLIFIGSDAWLAKGESPENGSIILIHGNKNEPLGIKKANQYLEKKDEKIEFGNLNESI